ncbi:MAG: reverse transcriptase domain-containing protein [Polyangiaceae bacterium]
MMVTTMTGTMSPQLLEVRERAKRDPRKRFMSLAHLIDEAALKRAYDSIRKDAAVGVDGITKEQYGQDLDVKLRDLHQRLRSKTWRHQSVRRVHIPKEQGKTRPIGISSVEDKVVQGAVREVLEAVYEPVFLDVSFGFRRGRGAHDALRALHRVLYQGEVNWILEADIVSFFDSVDRRKLMEMLRERVADGSLLRLIGKCLHVGTFDFLGFTLHWQRARSGHWGMMCKTRSARLRRSVQAVADWCRRHRHLPVTVQHAALTRRIQGHFNYFGISGNFRSLLLFVEEARRAWYKWLRRRSQRRHLTWESFGALVRRLPLPRPRITVRIWGT